MDHVHFTHFTLSECTFGNYEKLRTLATNVYNCGYFQFAFVVNCFIFFNRNIFAKKYPTSSVNPLTRCIHQTLRTPKEKVHVAQMCVDIVNRTKFVMNILKLL